MDIKELDKKQLILLTLLITFVVSIATGIVTVSLMSQAPKNVPQTINNVIQRTIEKVSTVEAPKEKDSTKKDTGQTNPVSLGNDALVSVYPSESKTTNGNTSVDSGTPVSSDNNSSIKELGQGVIISDVGLVLVDSSILNDSQVYKIVLDKTDFNAVVLKKFSNGFSILKITEKTAEVNIPEEAKNDSGNTTTN